MLEDVALTGHPPHEVVYKGVAHVPEGRKIFNRLTVAENLEMGAYSRTDVGIGDDKERVFSLFPRLKERLSQVAGTLSGGEQQMLAIGRALMARPPLLFLGEPSMGLAPVVVEQVFGTVVDINRRRPPIPPARPVAGGRRGPWPERRAGTRGGAPAGRAHRCDPRRANGEERTTADTRRRRNGRHAGRRTHLRGASRRRGPPDAGADRLGDRHR